jgi:hypothetical protein
MVRTPETKSVVKKLHKFWSPIQLKLNIVYMTRKYMLLKESNTRMRNARLNTSKEEIHKYISGCIQKIPD